MNYNDAEFTCTRGVEITSVGENTTKIVAKGVNIHELLEKLDDVELAEAVSHRLTAWHIVSFFGKKAILDAVAEEDEMREGEDW